YHFNSILSEYFIVGHRKNAEAEVRRRQFRKCCFALQVLHHLPHARPAFRQRMRAQQSKLQNQLHLLHHVLFSQPRIPRRKYRSLPPILHHPIQQNQLLPGRDRVHRPRSTSNLQEEDSECKHVGDGGRLSGLNKLGSKITHGSDDVGGVWIRSMFI
ncbi:hypothetical protein MUK42_06508, partial [Musa troglodytarum]